MLDLLSRNWWTLVVRGLLAIVFGVLALSRPGITLATLVIFFGAYILVDGIFGIVGAIGNWANRDDRWLLLLEGLLGVGIGILALKAPQVTAGVLLMFVAAWALATGVLEIVAAIRLRKEIQGEFWLVLSGIISVVLAFLLMFFPAAGALSILWLISIYAIVFGVILIIGGLKLRGLRSQLKSA